MSVENEQLGAREIDNSQSKIEAQAQKAEAPSSLKEKLAQAKSVLITAVNLGQAELANAFKSLKTSQAKNYLVTSAQKISGFLLAVARDGEILSNSAAKPSEVANVTNTPDQIQLLSHIDQF